MIFSWTTTHLRPFVSRCTDIIVETVYERGWSRLLNGELIGTAESSGFDLLITTDKGIRHQQNWSGRKLALLVLGTNDWARLKRAREEVLRAVNTIFLLVTLSLMFPGSSALRAAYLHLSSFAFSSRQEPVYHFQQKLWLVGHEDMTGLRHENKLSPGDTPGDDAAVLGR